jgi:hypothetical protein
MVPVRKRASHAGVVSGAGDLRPGIILDRHGKGGRARVPISPQGKGLIPILVTLG